MYPFHLFSVTEAASLLYRADQTTIFYETVGRSLQ